MISINHGQNPDAILFAYASDGYEGNSILTVTDEAGNQVGKRELYVKAKEGGSTNLFSRILMYIRDDSATVKNYTVTVTTETGDAAYTIRIGNEESIIENFGGKENAATITRNVAQLNYPMGGSVGYTALLNSPQGEWFEYVADGYTYITANEMNCDSLAFRVFDAETGEAVIETNENDRLKEWPASTFYEGYVQKGVDLEAGHRYYIQIYSTAMDVPCKSPIDVYGLVVGPPDTGSKVKKFESSQSYALPANQEKTFRFTISNELSSSRVGPTCNVAFQTGTYADDLSIDYCKITAPNGITYNAPMGIFQPGYLNCEDILTDPNNLPLNGTWTVRIRASERMSGLKFSISGGIYYIIGNYGNEKSIANRVSDEQIEIMIEEVIDDEN